MSTTLKALPITLLLLSLYILPVHAAGTIITFNTLDNFFDSFIITIQHYTLPIMTIVLVFLGAIKNALGAGNIQ